MSKKAKTPKVSILGKKKITRKQYDPWVTPDSRIQSFLRKLWLQSRERGYAVKREKNHCEDCGAKGTRAKDCEIKIEVHHRKNKVNWPAIYEVIRRELLVHPDELKVMCAPCHYDHDHAEDDWMK